jgi:quinoprotein glucose dehydrogenase
MTPVLVFRTDSLCRLVLLVTAAFTVALGAQVQGPGSAPERVPKDRDWASYGGAPENNHYARLSQINRDNVAQLKIAWTFDTHEEGGLQTSPLILDGVLYGITPSQKIFALNAATGALLWKFDSGIKGTQPDRGLAYWAEGQDRRLLVES